MTVIVRRSDCHCGGIVGLFFDRLEVSRVTAPEETGEGAGYIAEVHYPAGGHFPCGFFLNGREISPERAHTMILNNSAARPDNAAGCDVRT